MIRVFDDVLPDPMAYRARALAQPFMDVLIGEDTFKGIADPPGDDLLSALGALVQERPVMTFLRKSPEGQREPNYIHSDADMGKATAIYYMNPDPPEGDGTTFWSRFGIKDGPWTEEIAAAARDDDGWLAWEHVPSRFNRAVVFDADLFHSRALPDNYGAGDEARLIQVAFLR